MIFLGAVLTWLYLPAFLRLLSRSGFSRPNYAGHSIPSSAGVVLAFSTTWTVTLALLWNWYPQYQATRLLLVINGFALLGLLDDMGGERGTKGWRGHLGQLVRGQLTTGMIKVLYGGALAVAVTAMDVELGVEVALNAALITVAAALFNQLDVRPLRTTLAFLALTPVLALAGGVETYLPITPLVGAVLAYLPFDGRCHAMLGDSGANALGATWGWAAGGLPTTWRWTLLLIFLAVHVVGERYSLQALGHRWLGRKQG